MAHHELNFPKSVQIGDITVRDGFQHEEIWIPTEAKLFYLEELILCGIKHLEVTNLGNPAAMPQFKDADELLKKLRNSKKLSKAGVNWNDISLTCVTIREKAVDRAILARKEGWGPDRILMMVSTDEEHHFANSGTTLPAYWDEAKRCIEKGRGCRHQDERHRVHDLGVPHFLVLLNLRLRWNSPRGGWRSERQTSSMRTMTGALLPIRSTSTIP